MYECITLSVSREALCLLTEPPTAAVRVGEGWGWRGSEIPVGGAGRCWCGVKETERWSLLSTSMALHMSSWEASSPPTCQPSSSSSALASKAAFTVGAPLTSSMANISPTSQSSSEQHNQHQHQCIVLSFVHHPIHYKQAGTGPSRRHI